MKKKSKAGPAPIMRQATLDEKNAFTSGILQKYVLTFVNTKKEKLEASGYSFEFDDSGLWVKTPAGEKIATADFLAFEKVLNFRQNMGNVWADVPNAPMMAAAVLAQAALEAIFTTLGFSVFEGIHANKNEAWLDFDATLFTMWGNGAGGVLDQGGESIIHPFLLPVRMLYMNAFGCAVRRGEIDMAVAVEMMLADWENMAIKTGNQVYVDMIRASIAEFATSPVTTQKKPEAQA